MIKWDEREILNNFLMKISAQKDMPAEYGQLVNDNFWDLV